MHAFFCPHRRAVLAALLTSAAAIALSKSPALAQGDPLPSWNDGKAKQSILDFVANVTREGSANFVPVPQRIATFDNDGTLWVEQPLYTQFVFALDRLHLLAPQHPEWKTDPTLGPILSGGAAALTDGGDKALAQLIAVTHAGMSTYEFENIVSGWLANAR